MKTVKAFVLILLLTYSNIYSQVGIGTTTPDDGSMLQIDSKNKAFVPPRMTDAEMKNISTPLEGAVVFNTTFNSLFVKTSSNWLDLSTSSNAYAVLNSGSGSYSVSLGDNSSWHNFPIGAEQEEILGIKNSTFEVTGDGSIKVKTSGFFLLSAALSVTNMKSGNTKYIIAAYKGNVLVGYLSRGIAYLPESDHWGTSGTMVYNAQAGEVLRFKYLLNYDNNTANLNVRFLNVGIMKL
tara:strand:- start:253 stop:963 length:711 start_codon:yes stop_codon:yes gene_type:complete